MEVASYYYSPILDSKEEMEHTEQKGPEAAVKSSTSAGEGSELQRGRYEAALGVIGGGTMSLLLTIGFDILPASTLPDKLLIIMACFALGLASWAGFGAWRSVRRFTVVAITATVAIVCMGALSIVANDTGSAQLKASGKPRSLPVHGSGYSSPAIKSGASPTVSSSQQGGASTGPPVYLADLRGDPGSTAGPQPGAWSMLNQSYAHSIGYPGDDNLCGPSDATVSYGIEGRYQYFQATVGLNDDADPEDQGMASNQGADFTVQANPGGGAMRTIISAQKFWGHPYKFRISVAGATLLELQTDGCLDSSNSVAVWGNASLFP